MSRDIKLKSAKMHNWLLKMSKINLKNKKQQTIKK